MNSKVAIMRDDARIWMVGGFLALCLGMMLVTVLFIFWRGASAFWPRAIEVIILGPADDSPRLLVGQQLSRDERSVRIQTSDPGFGTSRSQSVGFAQWNASVHVRSDWIQRVETRQSGALFGVPLYIATLNRSGSNDVSTVVRKVFVETARRCRVTTDRELQSGTGNQLELIADTLTDCARPAVRRERVGSKGDLSKFLRGSEQFRDSAASRRNLLAKADEQIANCLEDLAPGFAKEWLLLAQEQVIVTRYLGAIDEAFEFACGLHSWSEEELETLRQQFSNYQDELEKELIARKAQLDKLNKQWIPIGGDAAFAKEAQEACLASVSQRHLFELELSWAESLLSAQKLEFAGTTGSEALDLPVGAIARLNAIKRETKLSSEETDLVRSLWGKDHLGGTDARISSEQITAGVQLLRLDSERKSQVAMLVSGRGDFIFPLQMESVPLSDVEAILAVNRMSVWEMTQVYACRWAEFLSAAPRAAGTAGGIFPAIWGTVVLTLIMTLAVIPLGVVAALYLREYITASPLVSLVRISIHNLAGVPSIVYGVFGIAFFCYTLGAYLDGGPANAGIQVLPSPVWFVGLGIVASCSCIAFFCSLRIGRGQAGTWLWLSRLALLLWTLSLAGFCFLLLKSPFFEGFYRDSLPIPTFGKGGILWASLTLALLTLPIVIVSTEESLAMVPDSLRVGSFACGASKWQTIWNIVLPYARSGIVTGGLLAAARAVGQVAPLMLLGALPAVVDLPLDSQFPFLHPSRSFMHLGNQVYSLSQRSSDTEATQPMVYASILLLVLAVASLHLTANLVRARFRARFAQY